ncbi:MAG TPA: metalloregulator ArsR/SmtB family transcription factor [Acidimicrobiales bacterium]
MQTTTRRDELAAGVDLLKALATEVRFGVVAQLRKGPHCVHELQTALRREGRDVSQPLLSHHLRVLRDAGLVSTTRRGAEITYELADVHVGHLVSDALHLTQTQEERNHDDHTQ